jgi:hypothetical protein
VWWHPRDVDAGEHDYDPYALDVACLCNVFASEFEVSGFLRVLSRSLLRIYQAMAPQIPMLAALLDRMTTEDINARFSAREALDFIHSINESLTDDQRKSPPLRQSEYSRWYMIGHRWVGLPDHFV